jgi:hypothetical protein
MTTFNPIFTADGTRYPDHFQQLSGASLDKAIKAFEYDLVEEKLQPYIVDMTKELPEQQPLISIDDCCVCSRGNISAICGEAKSKKTFLASALVASAMAVPYSKLDNFKNVSKDTNINVLWVDTEQGERHVRRVIERITTMTGAKLGGAIAEPRLTTLKLRELDPEKRLEVVMDTIHHYSFDLIVIDGIADLQRNTNNLEESDALIGTLMALSTTTNTHILCVLHTNPGSDKARGHLGSALQRKAETVIFVHRSGDASIVEPQLCRNEPFERFAFRISEEGIPQLCDLPTAPTGDINEQIIQLLNSEYGGCIERQTLITKASTTLSIGSDAVRMRINRLVNKGTLIADGKQIRMAMATPLPTNEGNPKSEQMNERTGVRGVQNVQNVQNVQSVQSVQNVQSVQSVQNVQSVQSVQAVQGSFGDYDDCPF